MLSKNVRCKHTVIVLKIFNASLIVDKFITETSKLGERKIYDFLLAQILDNGRFENVNAQIMQL